MGSCNERNTYPTYIKNPPEIIRGSDIAPVVFIEGKGFVSLEQQHQCSRIGVTRATGMAFTLTAVTQCLLTSTT